MASEAEQAWLDEYLETGDAQQAVMNHFEVDEKWVPSRASQLKAKFVDEIDQRLRASYKKDAPTARKVINDLMSQSKNEMVKLKAAQDVLARAGHDPAHVVEHVDKQQTKEELEARLKAVLTGMDRGILQEMLQGTEFLEMAQKAMGPTIQ